MKNKWGFMESVACEVRRGGFPLLAQTSQHEKSGLNQEGIE